MSHELHNFVVCLLSVYCDELVSDIGGTQVAACRSDNAADEMLY